MTMIGCIQVEVVRTETIKPSRPTPTHLKTHHLSLFDQLAPHLYVPLVFFYAAINGRQASLLSPSQCLKASLSQTLSRYYPFAGRIKDHVSVDCNDEGVSFFEARTGFKLSEILKKPRNEDLDQLFPAGLPWKDSRAGPLLAIQITHFGCGGTSIAVCLSHKLADTSTMVAFINHFAAIARNNGEEEPPSPQFDAALSFPHGDLPPMNSAQIPKSNVVSRRFVFSASNISALKSMVSLKVQNPTAVEVVSALVFKSAISASSKSSIPSNDFIFCQTINLRTRVDPPLSESSAGNIVSFFPVSISPKNTEIDLGKLVVEMKANLGYFCDVYAKNYRSDWLQSIKKRFEESKKVFSKANQKVYRCSSWRRFAMYEADFGWGKPKWVTMAGFVMRNTVMMMDDENGDGIEALVSLDEEDMAAFEVDEELLSFASINPMVNVN